MKRKFVVWVTVINLVVLAAVVGFTLKIINDNYKDSVLESLEKQGNLATELFKQSNDYTATTNLVNKLSGNRVTIISSSGEVLADSDVDISTLGSHDTREEVQNSRKNNGIGFAVRYSDTLKKDIMYVAMPLDDAGVTVRIAEPLDSIWDNIASTWQTIALVIAAAIIIITFFTILRMNKIISPVKELTKTTKEIADGNYNKRVFVRGDKEINELAFSFNKMVEELDKAILELKSENIKLETVLNSIENGIIAVDSKMSIIMLNDKAKQLLNLSDTALTNNVLIASRNSILESMFLKCFREKTGFRQEMAVKDKKLLYILAPIIRDGALVGAVAVIEDVTEIRKLETVRSDFAANVSHELKTPLTIIKGFVDTLKDGAINDKEKSEKFLDIISIETERLTRLISDILYLSEIESESIKVEMRKLDLSEPVNEVVNLLSDAAKNKNIELKTDIEKDVFILGNKDRIKQLMLNLIDNAIKYTNNGGEVVVSVYKKEGKAYINVKDNGIGIAKEHIGRLFERFYRTDKSRSRDLGGTGLGLAIVKHIALTHNAQVIAQSEIDVGTTFKIEFPAYNITN